MQWSLYAGNKKPGTSFKWSLVTLYKWSLYRETFDLKFQGRTTTWSLRTGGRFKKVVVKTSLTVHTTWQSVIFQDQPNMYNIHVNMNDYLIQMLHKRFIRSLVFKESLDSFICQIVS